MKAAKVYLKEKIAEQDFFHEACTESDLTEVCYLIFEKSGGLSLRDKEQLSASLEQNPSMDTIANFTRHFQEKIISDWCECIQGTDPVTKVLRESVKNVLQYENFYIPVAAASYGHGEALDDSVMFSLSVSTTLKEWPGELPSLETMLSAFDITKDANIKTSVEQQILEILTEISHSILRHTEPDFHPDSLFSDVSDLVMNCFHQRTCELMNLTFHSDYEYKNFYYWLLSDIPFDALGVRQIVSYYLQEALEGDAIQNALEEAKKPFCCSMKENHQWFEEWCKHANL